MLVWNMGIWNHGLWMNLWHHHKSAWTPSLRVKEIAHSMVFILSSFSTILSICQPCNDAAIAPLYNWYRCLLYLKVFDMWKIDDCIMLMWQLMKCTNFHVRSPACGTAKSNLALALALLLFTHICVNWNTFLILAIIYFILFSTLFTFQLHVVWSNK